MRGIRDDVRDRIYFLCTPFAGVAGFGGVIGLLILCPAWGSGLAVGAGAPLGVGTGTADFCGFTRWWPFMVISLVNVFNREASLHGKQSLALFQKPSVRRRTANEIRCVRRRTDGTQRHK